MMHFWLNKTRYNQSSLDYKTIKMSARLLNYFEKEILWLKFSRMIKKSVETFSPSLNSPFKGLKILTWNGWKRGLKWQAVEPRRTAGELRTIPSQQAGFHFEKAVLVEADQSRLLLLASFVFIIKLFILNGISGIKQGKMRIDSFSHSTVWMTVLVISPKQSHVVL